MSLHADSIRAERIFDYVVDRSVRVAINLINFYNGLVVYFQRVRFTVLATGSAGVPICSEHLI